MTGEAESKCVTFKYVTTISKAINLPVDDMKPDGGTLNYNDDYIEKAGPGNALLVLTYLPGKPLPDIILSQSPKPSQKNAR